MAENTKIEWCHLTFNPWRGCTKVSPGCTNCYAETMSKRVIAAESVWRQPLKWDHEAKAAGERRRVFCASLADVFEDWKGPVVNTNGRVIVRQDWEECLERAEEPLTLDYFRFELFNLIRRTPNLDWLLLTRRPENVKAMTAEFLGAWRVTHQPNIWLGVSVENQAAADERIPVLLQTPAAVRFLSCEPLLEAVDLWQWLGCPDDGVTADRPGTRLLEAGRAAFGSKPCIDWVIVGGESGPRARPCNLAWVRSIVAQCRAASVPVFCKQLGSNAWSAVKEDHIARIAQGCAMGSATTAPSPWRLWLTDPRGGDPEEFPEDLRVRQFPEAAS